MYRVSADRKKWVGHAKLNFSTLITWMYEAWKKKHLFFFSLSFFLFFFFFFFNESEKLDYGLIRRARVGNYLLLSFFIFQFLLNLAFALASSISTNFFLNLFFVKEAYTRVEFFYFLMENWESNNSYLIFLFFLFSSASDAK